MNEQTRHLGWEIFDALFLAALILFNGWVALTQTAALAAPTLAITTASLLFPRPGTRIKTKAELLHRPLIAVGTTLTAFLWLLSAIEPQSQILPSNMNHAIVVMYGWILSTSLIIISPMLMLFGPGGVAGR